MKLIAEVTRPNEFDHPLPALLGQALAESPSVPAAVVERLRALAADFGQAYAPNTLRAWAADWRVWTAFCARNGYAVLPAPVDALRTFLQDAIASGRKRATLDRYLSTLACVHRLAEQPWPLDAMAGRLMWKALRRQLPARQDQAAGLTIDRIEAVIAALDERELRDVRDAALLALAYETMARASELVAMQVGDLSPDSDGSARVLIVRSKTDQEGEGALLYLSAETRQRVERWISSAGLEDGPLFRSVPRSRKPKAGGALFERDVSRIFKRRVGTAGLDVAGVSAHSTRVGPAQDLLAAGYGLPEIQQQGRWKSPGMVLRYGERIAAGRSAMARFKAVSKPHPKG